ncbi:hypothetical protein DPMN_151142 [Dreissena polymorpha]|uniref:Uncharacterized protein n=1 Tax=Dreissena polymorpha TaxID=45954 RepID=A0A9D4FEI5_DREPO|nr:hypothetical protein DPMN_151142 [Dreissena polymorpha]
MCTHPIEHPHLRHYAPSDKKEEHIYAGNKAMNLTMEERYPMKHGSSPEQMGQRKRLQTLP